MMRLRNTANYVHHVTKYCSVCYIQDKSEEGSDENSNWLYDVKFVFKKADGETAGRRCRFLKLLIICVKVFINRR
jgi:hypothetical protein